MQYTQQKSNKFPRCLLVASLAVFSLLGLYRPASKALQFPQAAEGNAHFWALENISFILYYHQQDWTMHFLETLLFTPSLKDLLWDREVLCPDFRDSCARGFNHSLYISRHETVSFISLLNILSFSCPYHSYVTPFPCPLWNTSVKTYTLEICAISLQYVKNWNHLYIANFREKK